MIATEHHVGELAYLDTFSGLVPCKVLRVNVGAPGHLVTAGDLTIKLTAQRGAYRKGEELTARAHDVIPRSHVRVRSGQHRISSNYAWKES